MPHLSRTGRRRTLALTGLGLACFLVAVGCGSAPAGGSGPEHTASAAAAATASGPASARAAAATHRLTKILVIMEENHSISQVFPSRMPYLWGLGLRYGRATAWSDISHPSLPNYLAIFGGSDFSNPQDCLPAGSCVFAGPSVFGQALAKGKTARAYEESMPSRCNRTFSGNYDVNHNPWAYFPSEAALCQANDVPAGTVAAGALASDIHRGTLPNVGLLTPNLIHDAHDGSLAQADAWLRSWMPVLFAGPDWRAGRLAIVVLFDEGVTTEQVAFVLIAPGLTRAVTRQPLNHYALTRLIDQIAGTPLLRKAAGAPSVAALLGLGL